MRCLSNAQKTHCSFVLLPHKYRYITQVRKYAEKSMCFYQKKHTLMQCMSVFSCVALSFYHKVHTLSIKVKKRLRIPLNLIDFDGKTCYTVIGSSEPRLPSTVGGCPLHFSSGGFFSLQSHERRAMRMNYISLSDLLQYTLVLIGFATLILTFVKKK